MFFTTDERSWLRGVTKDFQAYDWKDASAKEWRRAMLNLWYRRFPYRHPRHYRHSERAKEAHATPIFGTDWKFMPERMRNQINNIKADLKREDRNEEDSPANSVVTHWLENQHTQQGALDSLSNEAYFAIDSDSPLAIDPTTTRLTERVATRMDAWPSEDYASARDTDRHGLLADIPTDMEDICRLFASHSGGEFLMIGAWCDQHDNYQYYSTGSPRSQAFLRRGLDGSYEHFESPYLQFLSSNIGQGLAVHCSNAGPCVYASLDGSMKPRMPMQNLHWHNMNRLMLMYFEYMWAWQGGTGEIPWGASSLVDKRRMPKDIELLSHPDDWDQQGTWLWVAWIRLGQAGSLDVHARFQFELHGPTGSRSRLRKDIHPESNLRYGPDSRIFIGRLTRAGPDDLLSQNERSNYFIRSTRVLNTKLFTDEAETDILSRGESIQHMKTLLELVIRYEDTNPIRATSGHWKELQAGSPGLPEDPPERLTSLDDIDGWWIDESYFLERDSSSVHSAHQISTWLRSGRFIHPITKTLFGGPYGVKWAALVLVRMHATHAALTNNETHPYLKRYKLTRHRTSLLEADTRWVLESLLNSVVLINDYTLPTVQPMDLESPAVAHFQRAELQSSQYTDDDVEDNVSEPEEEGSEPLPSPATRAIRPLPRTSQRQVSFKGDRKPRLQLTVELQSRKSRTGSRRSVAGDSASTTSNSTRDLDQTDEDAEPSITADTEQADANLAAEMRQAIHLSRQSIPHADRGQIDLATPGSSSSRADIDIPGPVLAHLPIPEPMETSDDDASGIRPRKRSKHVFDRKGKARAHGDKDDQATVPK